MDRFAIWLQRLPSAILHLPGMGNSQSPYASAKRFQADRLCCVQCVHSLCHYHSYTEPTGESQRCSVLVKHFAVPFLYHHHSVPDLCSKGNYKELPSFRNQRQEAKPKLYKKVSNYSEFILWRDWIHFKWLNNLISSGMLRYTVPSTEKSGDGAWHVLYLQEVIRYRFKPVGTFHQVYFL